LATEQRAFAPHALDRAEERGAPRSDAEDAAEENDGIDAETPGTGPVGVRFEIEPDGELVECQGRSHAITHGHEPAEKDGSR
jgi:hypothetical protein